MRTLFHTFGGPLAVVSLLVISPACGDDGGGSCEGTGTGTGTGTHTAQCPDETSSGDGSSGDPDDGAPTTADDGGSSGDTGGSSTGGDGQTSGGDDGQTTGDDGQTTGGGGGTFTGEACEPADGDNDCTQCVKSDCCEAAQRCADKPECACFLGCYYGRGDLTGCALECEIGLDNPALGPLGECVSGGACQSACRG